LRVGAKSGSSFTWQSSVASIKTFKRGHIWKVGSSADIGMWKDHWIPTSPTRKIMTQRVQILLRTIDELIIPHLKSWDEPLYGLSFFKQMWK
jgi:hypothetical protein